MAYAVNRAAGALRISDFERERALQELRVHYAAGRLDGDELEERVEHAYRARTRAQLAATVSGLPLARAEGPLTRWVRRVQRALLRLHLAAYATANGTLMGIWALTGEGTFWPAWMLLPTTALLAWHLAASRLLTRILHRQPRLAGGRLAGL